MADMTVANTILATLTRDTRMACGIRNPMGDDKSLTVNILTGNSHKLRITLESSDTYKVERFRIWGTKVTTVEEAEGVYADALNRVVYHMVNK